MSEVVLSLITIAGFLAALLFLAAAMTWLERRFLGLWQDRYGPNRVGPFGTLQAVADVIKIMAKEDWIPPFADRPVFVLAPAIAMVAMLTAFAVIPVSPALGVAADLNIGLLFFLAMSSLAVYSVALGGWASNSKYALLGGLRAAAQMVSYEVFMGLSVMGVVLIAGTFSLSGIVEAQAGLWFVVPQFLGFVVFLVAGIAETHRLPFDLPEAETELIAGFHTEYSGMKFGMFFVGEYVGMVVVSAMITTLFFGGWRGPVLPPVVWFAIKTAAFLLFFVLLRAALPRPRYDQLMAFGWKAMLPLTLLNLVATGGVLLWLEQPA
ncbi:MAG: NADH-quinone oxidoreductase subunit NuoH [Geminicoccaceae bacterium]